MSPIKPRRIALPRCLEYFILCLLLLATSSQAAKYASDPFSLGVGARSLALGGAVIAGPFDATAPYWNPAGMNRLTGRSITAMHAETFGSLLNHDFVGYVDARPRGESSMKAFGFYLYYLGGGGIKITQLNEFDRPYVVREESHADILLSASLSGEIAKQIDIGVAAKILYRDIGTESGMGLSLDAGALYDMNNTVTLGLMITDITSGVIRYSGGSEVFVDDTSSITTKSNVESIYPTLKPAIQIKHVYRDFTGRLLAGGDVKFENLKNSAQYWSGPISIDTHYGFELGWREMLFGRAGFDIGNFTTGGGVDFRKVTVDIAYLHHDEFDSTIRVSAGYRF